ncbi:TetR/AcrR family transcriptional regulator [Vagococcus intermedius]|uniref:TetR/AcrR family transcriptional regulator n=1 Tax=Vagococcus intermedius TaxID=2991418 RepID=A0AAF0CTP3_9ENTE|nr:TetR/AcrR family transcriptional regulator [Vagococcus intermedius]WEG72664.1 TetR/AcrR family transcriptional regulator [Vagococcus intermedius]WEG74749.1 TetR/AcrR family transcriptional regulator [Vagococcus intermedius]
MPKETFLNLPTHKKELILKAALKEFSQYNIHEASVANIVRDSNISRGSFYKYFVDIEDLYYYLYHEITSQAHGTVIDALKSANGDLFLGLENYLADLVTAFSEDKYHDYFKVVTLNLNYVTQRKLAKKETNLKPTNPVDFTKLIQTEKLTITSQEDLLDFFKVFVPVIHECLNDYFANDWRYEQLMEEYHRRIKWLKYGILKKENE